MLAHLKINTEESVSKHPTQNSWSKDQIRWTKFFTWGYRDGVVWNGGQETPPSHLCTTVLVGRSFPTDTFRDVDNRIMSSLPSSAYFLCSSTAFMKVSTHAGSYHSIPSKDFEPLIVAKGCVTATVDDAKCARGKPAFFLPLSLFWQDWRMKVWEVNLT